MANFVWHLQWTIMLLNAIFSNGEDSHGIEKRAASTETKKVVCYYTNWSVYRPGTAKFSPQNINPYLCTHLIYAFGGLDRDNGLKPYDKYQDIEQGGYSKFNGLKTYNKKLKTLLAIGGWNEGSSRFSSLVASEERRKIFVKNVAKFLRQNNFDGLDLDWEYPTFRDGSKPDDKDNYASLVQELREEFENESSKSGKPRLLLTMAVPAGVEYIDKGYDVPKLNKYLDFMNILSYDYVSVYSPNVNHHAPLYPIQEGSNDYDNDAQLNIDYTVKHYLKSGADRDKLVLGIPTYGRSFTLFNSDSTDIGSPADGPGEKGEASREKGYLTYFEICAGLKSNDDWTIVHTKPSAMGPYAYRGNQWVGYDDEDIVKLKSKYVVQNELAGIMFWTIDNDDFRGKCHNRPYPLIEAAKEALFSNNGTSSKQISAALKEDKSHRHGLKRNKNKLSTSTTTTTTTTESASVNPLSTPEPPTTPDPGTDFVCQDEGFFPHPRDCRKYFWCLDSGPSGLGIVAHQFTCPSDLLFNKASDSCDYSRNVVCTKKSGSTTSTTAKPKVTSATARNTLFKQTSTTSTSTTTTSTTTEAAVEEYEDVENEDSSSEEDPKAIKKLVELIKKLGGIAELEKQLKISDDSKEATTPEISRSLYDKVFNAPSVNRYQSEHPNGPSGPQHEGLSLVKDKENDKDTFNNEDEVVSNKNDKSKWKPQYVTIQRSRSTAKPDESADDSEQPVNEASSLSSPITKYLEKADDAEEKQLGKEPESSTSTRNSVKKYSAALRTRTSPSLRSTTSRYVNLERPKKPDKINPSEQEPSDDRSVSPSNQRYVTHFRSKQNPAPALKESGNEESPAAASATVHRAVLEEKLLSNDQDDDEESGPAVDNDSALMKETTKVSDDAELNNKASVPLPVTSAPTVKYVTVSRASSKLENNDDDDNDNDDNNNNNNNNSNNSNDNGNNNNNNSSSSSSSSSTISNNFDNNVEYKQSLDGENSFLEIGSNRRIFDRVNSAAQQQPAPTTYDVPATLTSVVTSIFEEPVTERKRIPVRGLNDYLSRRQLAAKSSTTKQQQPQSNESDGTETSTSAGKRRRIGAFRPKEKSLAAAVTEESSKNASSENSAELSTAGGPFARRRTYIRSSSSAPSTAANEQTNIYARFPKRKDRYPLVTRSTGDYFASSSPVDELATEKSAGYRFSRRRSSSERTNTFSPSNNRLTPTSVGLPNATSELVIRERLFPRRRSKYNDSSVDVATTTGSDGVVTDSSSVSGAATSTPADVSSNDDAANRENVTAERKTSPASTSEIAAAGNKNNVREAAAVASVIATTTKSHRSSPDDDSTLSTVVGDDRNEERATESFETLLLNENSNSFNTPFDIVSGTRKKPIAAATKALPTTTEPFSTVQFPIISDAKQKPYDKIIYIKLDGNGSSVSPATGIGDNYFATDELGTTNDDTTNSLLPTLSTSSLSPKTKPTGSRDRKKTNSPIYRIKKLNELNYSGAFNGNDTTENVTTNATIASVSPETGSVKSYDNGDDDKSKKQSDLFKRTTVWSKSKANEDRIKQYGGTRPATASPVTNPVSDWLSESMKVVGEGDKNTIFEFDFKANDNKMSRSTTEKETDGNPILTMMMTTTRFENDYDVDRKTATKAFSDSLKPDPPPSTLSESNRLHGYDTTAAASSTVPPRSIRNRSKYKFKQDDRVRNNVVATSSASPRDDESPSSSETFSTTPSYRVRQQFRRPSSFHRTRSTSAFTASTTEPTSTTGLDRLYKFTRRRRPKPEYTSSTEAITELNSRGRKFEVEQRSSSLRDVMPVATTSLSKSDHSKKNLLSDMDADNTVPEDGYMQTVAIQPDTLSTETVSDSDLANAAVIAIHSLRSAPPAPFSPPTTESLLADGYKYKIRTSTVDVKTPVAFSRQTITHHRRGSSRPLRTTTVKPYSPITRDVYSDYRDSEMELRADPVEIPVTGKVRIHADGYIECLDMGNFPHPFSCKKFISCAKMKSDNLLGWEYTCPRGLSFDPIGGICNWEAGLGCKE